ncbi:MAG TPA: carbohydrate ABC transporter permease [Firmicutes bacterium]|nr:carbohydrate ABC transporter permease [Bacillota bacterium]HHY98584.1 carbohydrate ABC transporter permease [Bacillota bacterium]
MRKRALRRNLREGILHLAIILLVIMSFYPFVFMILSSFKSTEEFYHSFFGLPQGLLFMNYVSAWAEIAPYLLNSAIVSCATVLGIVILASVDAYVFARFRFPGREAIFMLIIALLMIPSILTLIPAFLIVRDLGLLNTYGALVLPYISGGQILALFILRSFFDSVPQELFEAAKIDGASEPQCFWNIVLPLSKPILFTVGILSFQNSWNEYVWPLVTITEKKLLPITVGLVTFQTRYMGSAAWGPLFAGYAIATIPLVALFLFTMKYYIAGMTSGALKL